MITRIKAVKSTFGLALTTFEMVIAFHFLASLVKKGGDGFLNYLSKNFPNRNRSISFIETNNLSGPASFLLVVLCFMLFVFFLVSFVPQMVKKQERQIEVDFE
ncbi:MAG TPA: hypothetical protein VK255_00610 [Patescibacteria group bacterium]|nr:hypothetical protein [Patescibacteria group bacterium]